MKRILSLMAFASILGLAQQPDRSGPPTYIELQAYLQLSDTQLQSLRRIQQQQDADLQPWYRLIAGKTERLGALLTQAGADAAQIGQLAIDIANLRREVITAAQPYRAQAFALLTDDQKNLLPKLADSLLLARIARSAVNLRLFDDPTVITAPIGQ